jgi:hypothetical protein
VTVEDGQKNSELDVTGLSSGMYVVEITSSLGKSVNRFVKK